MIRILNRKLTKLEVGLMSILLCLFLAVGGRLTQNYIAKTEEFNSVTLDTFTEHGAIVDGDHVMFSGGIYSELKDPAKLSIAFNKFKIRSAAFSGEQDFRRLKNLDHLRGASFIEASVDVDELDFLKNVEALRCERCTVVSAKTSLFPQVVELSVVDSSINGGIASFLHRFPNLAFLHLENMGAEINLTSVFDGISELEQLKSLKIIGANLGDGSLDGLANASQLESLRLINCQMNTEAVDWIAKHCKSLKVLNLSENPQLDDSNINAFLRLSALKHLKLGQTGISDEGIAALREKLPEVLIDPSAEDK